MSEPVTPDAGLSPFGTATQRFFADEARAQAALPAAALTEALRRRAHAHDVPPEVVSLAGELVRLAPDLSPGDLSGLLHLAVVTLLDLRAGSTRTPVFGAEGQRHLERQLAPLEPDPEARGRLVQDVRLVVEAKGARAVVGGPDDYTPLVRDGDHVYLQRMRRLEARLADSLAARARGAVTDAVAAEAALADVWARPTVVDGAPMVLSEEQRHAVTRVLTRPLTVISGGPGTGKTFIVVAILRALVRAGVGTDQIALAAPTGKAANRMAEALRRGLEAVAEPTAEDLALVARAPVPATLHRLLGYRPADDTFLHHAHNPLAERVVVVDESSMIDLDLMERLARAVRPDARLVLLGDAEQLPSVDAGAVLRDVRAAEAEVTVQLTQSYRMRADDPDGRAILSAAAAINAGDADRLLAQHLPVTEAPSWHGIARLEGLPAAQLVTAWDEAIDDEAFQAAAQRVYRSVRGSFSLEDEAALAALERALSTRKLLCLTRNPAFATGAEAVNARVHQRRVAAAGLEAADLLPGEPVMMLHNDYERRLFNGDQGVVVRVAQDREAPTEMVVFRTEQGFEPFPLAQLRPRLALAHAMTVHKAQGSEFDHVAVLLPDVDLPLLTRELLYTAVTRAKRSVLVVGSEPLLRRGVRRTVERHSGVGARLAAALAEETET